MRLVRLQQYPPERKLNLKIRLKKARCTKWDNHSMYWAALRLINTEVRLSTPSLADGSG